ncbi:MAG TPA: hypothetical protein VD887_06100 [Allosphingosinicella sp.]|nr:hypothetical protein [Allosphingosinicella sp.]
MTRQPPPLRFLVAVIGFWACARALMLAPDLWVAPGTATPIASTPRARTPSLSGMRPVAGDEQPAPPHAVELARPRSLSLGGKAPARPAAPIAVVLASLPIPAASGPPHPGASPSFPQAPSPAPASAPRRWSGAAWLLLRDDTAGALAPAGTLGGSQSGLRLSYRLNGDPSRPLAVSARFTMPVARRAGAEVALGLDWRPFRSLPVHLLAERRQALGRDGRSALSLSLHAGVAERMLPGGFRLEAYGQAGMVGARSHDLFADGAARLTLPATNRLSLGAGLWGGAQPGAARLDAGPHASIRLPLAGESVRLSVEYRFRIVGDARPGSGPAITLSSDF